MNTKLNIILLTAIVLMISCHKEEGTPNFVDIPVIEAYLKAGGLFEIKIARQIPFMENATFSSDDIDALAITITSQGSDFSLSSLGNGRYTNTNLVIAPGNQYDLKFNYNNKEVSASTIIPSKPINIKQSVTELGIRPFSGMIGPGGFGNQPDPVKLTWDNPNASWHVVVVENIEASPKPIRADGTSPTRSFRFEPTQGNSYELRAGSFQYFGKHRIVLFHITPDYAILFDDRETTSQNITTPLTGIRNGVGIFAGINSDTLWLDVIEQW